MKYTLIFGSAALVVLSYLQALALTQYLWVDWEVVQISLAMID